MNPRNTVFKTRVLSELESIDIVVNRILSSWEKAKRIQDDLYMDAAALNLHGFYGGVEKVFELIAKEIDHSVPTGTSWHRDLAAQMTMSIPSIRPAVISKTSEEMLDEYRGFRHVVRNVYSYHFSEERLKILIVNLVPCYSSIKEELTTFLDQIN